MSNVYLVSDLHIGHKNIHNFRKFLNGDGTPLTPDEHWNSAVEGVSKLNKRDVLYLLGDIVFDARWLEVLKATRCRKILIAGNHDTEGSRGITMRHIVDTYAEVYSFLRYKKLWLSHAPIHPSELRGKRNAHGHTHYHSICDNGELDSNYINCCVEYTGYTPITIEYAISNEYYTECCKKHKDYLKAGILKGGMDDDSSLQS